MSEQNIPANANPDLPWVIACGDEGIQINYGRRLAFLGAGLKLTKFDQVLSAVRQMLEKCDTKDRQLRLVANEENAYIKEVLELNDFD